MTMTVAAMVEKITEELSALADPRVLAVNEKHGDEHAVNLTKLRAVAKAAAKDSARDLELVRALWATDDAAARLAATLIVRPRDLGEDELDAMLRSARAPKVQDWLVNYVVMKGPHKEALRERWTGDPDPAVAAAAWNLTTERIVKKPEGIELGALLDTIGAEAPEAPEQVQWAMNFALGEIGIRHEEHRARVLEMGEQLGLFRDYPTPPGCVSPFVPIWVSEMVGRAKS